MKRTYTAPTVEKLSFCYRDHIGAASGDSGNPADAGTSTPSFGSITSENWGSNGCKAYLLESAGWGFCDYL